MKIYNNTGFQIGFIIGIFIWLVLNLLPWNVNTTEHRKDYETGFPFTFDEFSRFDKFSSTKSMFSAQVPLFFSDWNKPALLADILIGIVFCFAAGLFFKAIADAFSHHLKIRKIKAEAKTAK